MTRAAIFALLALAWCIAVLIKLAGTRSRGEPYCFGMWDGGLALRGRTIGRTGTTVLAGVCIVLGIAAGYVLTLTTTLE